MSSYYDDRRTATRDRRRDDYDDDDTYANTRTNTAIVKRRNDSPEYDEEIRRDFSPGGGYYRETTIRKSGVRPQGRPRSFEDNGFDDDRSYASTRQGGYYGAAAAGGRRSRGDDRRDDRKDQRRSRYDSDYSSRDSSPPRRPKNERRKSMPEQALEAVGLGGLAATLLGKKDRSRSRSRSGSRRGGRRSDSEHRKEQLQQALKAAVLAGAASAFSARHAEGGWKGEKGKRVLTAALTAGGVDGFINRDKDPEKHKLRDTVGSAVAGFATDQLVNGRSMSRGRDVSPGGTRRARSSSGFRDLLAGGALATAAKKATDSIRGRSQSRGRRYSDDDSYDSRSPPRQRQRSRSRSVIASGLSKIGLSSQADKVDPAGRNRRRSRSRSVGGSRYADDDYDDRRGGGRDSSMYDPPNYGGGGRGYNDNRDVSKGPSRRSRDTSHPRDDRSDGSRSRDSSRDFNPFSGAIISKPHSKGGERKRIGTLAPPPPGYTYTTKPQHNSDPETDSDSDLGSSTDDEQAHKKSRKKLLLTGGLASVATIHAGHSVHQSMEKRQIRKRAIKDGTISKEEAAKHKSRDRMQDAASIGLAALGIKGAYSEWKETRSTQEELNEEMEKRRRHARKREARRMKYEMVGKGGGDGYTASGAAQGDPSYGGQGYDEYGGQQYYHGSEGPYMSGANGPQAQQGGRQGNVPQYYDDNPYASGFGQQGGYGYQGNGNYGPPPLQGGNGFPPPPVGQPPPPQGR